MWSVLFSIGAALMAAGLIGGVAEDNYPEIRDEANNKVRALKNKHLPKKGGEEE